MHQRVSLQQELRDQGVDVEELRIRVIPENAKKIEQSKPKLKREIPLDAAKILRQTAQNVQHESLKSSLKRLGEHENPELVD